MYGANTPVESTGLNAPVYPERVVKTIPRRWLPAVMTPTPNVVFTVMAVTVTCVGDAPRIAYPPRRTSGRRHTRLPFRCVR